MKKGIAERTLHRACAQYLARVLKPEVVWTTFPAGGGGKARGGMLKALGLKAGWPDIQIIREGRYYGIELKTVEGALSRAQRDVHDQIILAGGFVSVCRSVNDLERQIVGWNIPNRLSGQGRAA